MSIDEPVGGKVHPHCLPLSNNSYVHQRVDAPSDRRETSETLLICDGCTLTVDRVPEGKFKVRSGTAVVDTTILSDQVLELRISHGQVHFLRRRKVLDPEDQFPLGARGRGGR